MCTCFPLIFGSQRTDNSLAAILAFSSVVLATFLPTYVSAAAPAASSALLHIARDTSTADAPVTGQVIVKFKEPQAALAARSFSAQVLSQRDPSMMVVKLPQLQAKANAVLEALRKMPGVAYVENDEPMKAFVAPNDYFYTVCGAIRGVTPRRPGPRWTPTLPC